ncbi:MAG: M48 family metallopeptidase [Haloferacaceae archaeon]
MSAARPRLPFAVRFLMAVAGLASLFVYAVFAFLLYRGLLFLWARRPDPVLTALVVAALALALGYASYRLGTARIRAALDAAPLPRRAAPRFHDRVDALAEEMDVEDPQLLVGRLGQPNALALGGPRDGDVILDASLFDLLDAAELEGIVAHELAHLESRDALVKTLGYSLVRTVGGLLLLVALPAVLLFVGTVRAVSLLRGDRPTETRRATALAWAVATGLATAVLVVPVLALLAYSRRREFAADARAAETTGRPLALARGLARIARASSPGGPFSSLYIHGDEERSLTRLLASHPPMDERVERLAERADGRREAVRR